MINTQPLPFKPFIITENHNVGIIRLSNIGEFMTNKGHDKKDFEQLSSHTFRFNVDKVESYNDVFKCWIKYGKTYATYNEIYEQYRLKIAEIYDRLDHIGTLTKFITKPAVRMVIEFYINNKRKDIDNIEKPFIDALFMKAKTKNSKANDNCIYEKTSRKKFTYEEKEYIIIKFEVVTIAEMENSSLLYEDKNNF